MLWKLNLISSIGIIIVMIYISSISLAYTWVLVRQNSIKDLNTKFNTIFIGIIANLSFNINSAINVNNYATEYMKDYTLFNGTFDQFIKLSALQNSSIQNNVAIFYNISNTERLKVEKRLSMLLNKTINISDLEDDKKTLKPAAIREFYCPLTFISPMVSIYTGLDVCALPQFIEVLKTINSTKLTILPRQSIVSSPILNFASKTDSGFTSVTLDLNKILNTIKQNINYNIEFELSLNNKTFYTSCNSCNAQFEYFNNVDITNSDSVGVRVYFKDIVIDYNTFIYILFIVLILDIIIIVFLSLFYIQKKRYEIADLMLGYINHEIRNPLNCIKGLIEITIDDLNNNKIENLQNLHTLQNLDCGKSNGKDLIKEIEILINNEYINSNLSTAKNACELLNHIVNDILDFKKLYDGKLIINKTDININDFKKTVYNIIRPKLSEILDIDYSFESDVETIYSDKDRILQIMLNFLTNSIKFTDSGFIKVKIEQEINNIKISVSDSGIGIANADKSRIFQPYEHSELKDSLRHGGIGLGLFLSKMMVELLHGEIGFTSQVNLGSTFYIKIPLK
jgi:signal transduction histidine kinase